MRYDQALSALIYGSGMQARLWLELEGAAEPKWHVATTQRVGDIVFSAGAKLLWEDAPHEPPPPPEVPEPGTCAMLGTGLAAALFRRVLI